MSGPTWKKTRRWLRSWSPIFLGRDGTQPLSLLAEYRSVLHNILARRLGQSRTWRRSLSEQYEALSTIVRSYLSAFSPPPCQFSPRQLVDESQVLESSDTATPPRKTRRLAVPRIRPSRATNYLLSSPLKRSRWLEKPSKALSVTSQSPNGGYGVQRCGIGCLCSRCYHYRGWF